MVRVTKRWAVPGAVAAGALLLAGCSSTEVPSAAAIVGSEEISLAELDSQLGEINELLGIPANAASPDFTRNVLSNNVAWELIDQTAESLGVRVTEAEVQVFLGDVAEFGGGPDQFLLAQAQSGVAPSMIEPSARTSLLATAIITELAPSLNVGEAEQVELLRSAVRAYSEEVGTTVNPRFGYWSDEALQITLDPGSPVQQAELTDLPLLP